MSESEKEEGTHPSAAPTASDRDDGAAVRTIPDVAGCIPASSSLAAVEAANVTLSTENAQLRQALRVIRKGLSDDSDGEFWPARRWLDRRDIFHGDLSGNRVLELVAKHALHGNIAMPSTGVGLKTVEYLWNNGDFDGLIAFVRELLAGNPLTTEVLSAAAASPASKASDKSVPDPLRGHDAEPRLNSAARWAVEELSKHVTMCAPDCTCEDCPQCGQDPHDCTGTDCARTCQCSYCDHCEAMEVIRAIEAALVAPLLPDATLQHVRDYLLWHQSCDGPSLIGDSRVAMDAQTRVLRRLLGWLELGDSYLDAHIALVKQQVASSSLPVSEPSGVHEKEKNDDGAALLRAEPLASPTTTNALPNGEDRDLIQYRSGFQNGMKHIAGAAAELRDAVKWANENGGASNWPCSMCGFGHSAILDLHYEWDCERREKKALFDLEACRDALAGLLESIKTERAPRAIARARYVLKQIGSGNTASNAKPADATRRSAAPESFPSPPKATR